MKRTNIRRSATVAAVVAVLGLGTMASSCGGSSKPGSAEAAQKAGNTDAGTTFQKFSAAVPYPYKNSMPSDPLERKNLAKRLTQYNSKGSTNYVYIFAGYTDKVLGYYVISGKVSSTSSQMTSTQVNTHCGDGGDAGAEVICTNDAIGDDGSYGPDEGGDDGVFFFTTNGTLVETNQPWVVSSSPIKLYANAPELDAKAGS